ncbi:MAG: methylenetetrahydrofolate reductase C-terminal domain-containing protein [Kiritimatiellales bacterium]|nr:methylenetetrahydrofolate reductase C-terminal domain-containing protein [Kiritimatiellales bacterium]MCF7864138.1 methylenetetrahydrofolate reductase C-terminal domain-containing protein [Kiritimatiellales bacterium]
MKRLKQVLADASGFAVIAELTSGPGYDMAPIKQFLSTYREAGAGAIPLGFDFAGIALPQNPGGVSNLDPSDVLAQLDATGLLDNLDYIPHLSCKDHNKSALSSMLIGYRQRGVESILALTGDKPVSAKGVFEVESVGLLQMVSKMNRAEILKASPATLGKVAQFFAGAAVSPFKYTEPSLMQQYYKMEKKVAVGARFLITQVGWDWRKSLELMTYLDEAKLTVPVIGNVFFLSTANPAPRLMHDGKLPGCYVSDALLEKLKSESFAAQVERAAQQVAMYRSIGAAGVDIGGVHDFETFKTILARAAEIGDRWTDFKDNLYWPPADAYYLYDDEGRRNETPKNQPTAHDRRFNFMHNTLLDPDRKGFHLLEKTMEKAGAKKNPNGLAGRTLFAMERAIKHAAFECEECGDCFLAENFGYCTMGGCAKGLANAPCGDAKVDGTCGNEKGVVCRGEQIYLAAKAQEGGLARLRKTINSPRIASLEHSSSILNYLFGKDHTMKNAIITIGEDIHASIPKNGAVMRELHALGAGAYEKESPQLDYVRALIENQAAEGADYLAINVDAFGESDPQLAVDIMVEYVKLVRQWGGTVPACIDSSNNNVLMAGLKEWYNTTDPVKPPLVNSIKVYSADTMMPLKKEYDFSFVGLLMSEGAPTGPGGSHSVEELYAIAEEIFDQAILHGFKPEEIFFDSTVYPLAIDMPMQPGVPGYTYRAFQTMKAIRSNPKMKGVHFSMGVSNCCRDLPGRKVGICRAYVEKAMEYGLDAGIVNAAHKYGATPADPSLVKLVAAYAEMDGDMDKTNDAIELMGDFCDSLRK